MKHIFLLAFSCVYVNLFAQIGRWPNGTQSSNYSTYALKNIKLYVDADNYIENGILVWQDGKILASGAAVKIPENAVVIDGHQSVVMPAFIDLYAAEAGLEFSKTPTTNRGLFYANESTAKYENDAIKADYKAVSQLTGAGVNDYAKNGFLTLNTFHADGIVRGSSALFTVSPNSIHKNIVLDNAALMLSFSKGSSAQSYPGSLVGAVALLRQSFYNAIWYEKTGKTKEYNSTLAALAKALQQIKIVEASDKWDAFLVKKLAEEFNMKFIIKASGTEYQRIEDIKSLNMPFILPLNFPEAYNVKNPDLAANIWYNNLLHWEMAEYNPLFFHKNQIPYAFTLHGLKNKADWQAAIKRVYKTGLPSKEILRALTLNPAKMLQVDAKLGHLKPGAHANFIISKGEIGTDEFGIIASIGAGLPSFLEAWPEPDYSGKYTLFPNANNEFDFSVTKKGTQYQIKAEKALVKFELERGTILLNFAYKTDSTNWYKLTGKRSEDASWLGTGTTPGGESVLWSAKRISDIDKKSDNKATPKDSLPVLVYPFNAYGKSTLPVAKEYLIKNITVWTSAKEGVLEQTDVILKDGKIAKIGKSLSSSSAEIIDGTGKFLTAGIIDEHSHIALRRGVNEGGANISAEVRMVDALNPDDINIYRHISGGITTVQQLHGSANPVGGQSSIIKLKWGETPENMVFKNAVPFIKFALGENVKQSNWGNGRYPQSRAGVEQTFDYWFTRALEYEKNKEGRVDLRLETLLEILKGKRFITCHSYVQSEINMLMKLADKFGFKVNTFTHILEGYKVADKMKEHGAAASTFADWWAYKMEVNDAIPYNASILHKMGVVTAINSDDAEMGRRLNHEAAKLIKYGGLSEQDAWKTVTINPARMLHIDKYVGSIEVGKNADVVIWNANPLSVYASVEYTFIDGALYFERKAHASMMQEMAKNRARIIEKMAGDKSDRKQEPIKKKEHMNHCEDFGGHDHE